METKICTKCGQDLPIDQFNWRDKSKGTRRADCKFCHNNFMKIKYQQKRQEVSQLKLTFKCEKCGYDKCSEALDFHHKDPNLKDEGVATMISNRYHMDKVWQEIQKCVCLCANCHREFHYREKTEQLTIERFLEE